MTTTMTCRIGKFTFEDGEDLSLMKLVRDTVMGQMLQPKQRTVVVETEEEAYDFIRTSDSQVLVKVGFQLELSEDFKSHQLDSLLKVLADQASISGKQMKQTASRFEMTLKDLGDMLNRYRALANQGVFI